MTADAIPLYRLEEVGRSYGEREVCRVRDLDVQAGEVLAILGPNGAGKSTLLRLLAFVERPSSGSIFFQGRPVANGFPSLEERRQVAMVFQEPVFLRDTVYANVAYGLRLRGRRSMDGRVEKALAALDLLSLARSPASHLSGGEAQRVALARALVLEPRVLLVDEPTANLDPYHVAQVEGMLRALNRERGSTIVLVTHNVFQARRLAQRACLMLDGEVVEVAPAGDFFSQPRDPRTSAFVRGEMVY